MYNMYIVYIQSKQHVVKSLNQNAKMLYFFFRVEYFLNAVSPKEEQSVGVPSRDSNSGPPYSSHSWHPSDFSRIWYDGTIL
jgi:hypothetical protein